MEKVSGSPAERGLPMKRLIGLLRPFPFTMNVLFNLGQLEEMASLAEEHNVLPLFYRQLRRCRAAREKNDAISRFLVDRKQVFLEHIASSLPTRMMEKQVSDLLKSQNIPAFQIKGTSLAEQVYDDINCRKSSDVDLLIREEDLETTDNILQQSGYERTDSEPTAFLRSRRHHTTYVADGISSRIPIEIHWNFSIPGFFGLTSSDIWKNVIQRQDGSFELQPHMMLILLFLHHHMHAFKHLRNIADLYWAMSVYDKEIDWHDFTKKAKEIGLRRVVNISVGQIADLWPNAVKELQGPYILTHSETLDKKRPFSAFLASRIHVEPYAARLSAKDKILFRLSLDDWRTLLFSFVKTLFPAAEHLQILFPDRGAKSYISNYIRYIIWRFFR